MNMVRRVLLMVPLVIFALGGLSFFLYSPTSKAAPAVTWSPSSLSVDVGAGPSTTTQVIFTASANASDVGVWVVPEIAPYVSVSPGVFPSLADGSQYAVAVTVAAPSDAPLAVFDGTIHLRKGKKTLAKPLPVEVEVVDDTI